MLNLKVNRDAVQNTTTTTTTTKNILHTQAPLQNQACFSCRKEFIDVDIMQKEKGQT